MLDLFLKCIQTIKRLVFLLFTLGSMTNQRNYSTKAKTMKIYIHFMVAKASLCGAIIICTGLFYGCAISKPDPAPPAQSYNINRQPIDVVRLLKMNDFGLNPPVVEDFTVKKLTQDKEIVAVRFIADERLGRTVTITPGKDPIVLHDDGLNGDHVYSAIVPSAWDSRAAEQDGILTDLKRINGPLIVPTFNGRDVVGGQKH